MAYSPLLFSLVNGGDQCCFLFAGIYFFVKGWYLSGSILFFWDEFQHNRMKFILLQVPYTPQKHISSIRTFYLHQKCFPRNMLVWCLQRLVSIGPSVVDIERSLQPQNSFYSVLFHVVPGVIFLLLKNSSVVCCYNLERSKEIFFSGEVRTNQPKYFPCNKYYWWIPK